MKEKGKVWLVGAGPSDPGLFTLKGKQVLEEAEVVVYDALAGQAILNMIPETAETVNVGKRSHNHMMPQEKINELLVEKAREGKRVVRLKGGDPFLFGRGGEELELLVREGIPFEIVPGVTSAIAVPAYQGIPVTHRDFCSSVHIITGHRRTSPADAAKAEACASGAGTERAGGTPSVVAEAGTSASASDAWRECRPDRSQDIDYEALVRTGGTLVFLMGVGSLGKICRGLLGAGMEPDAPAALLSSGTTAAQERIVATVSTLEEEVSRRGAKTPAVIVVGGVCALAEEFAWYEKQPLGGTKILLTRPKELVSETAAKLRGLGAEVLELPAIRTVRLSGNEPLHRALEKIEAYQWIVFTSPAGVRIFFEELVRTRTDVRRLAGAKLAVIGSGTRRELDRWGLYADLMPEIYDGEHLGEVLAAASAPEDRILIPRAATGNKELTARLAQSGKKLQVDDIATYDTIYENGRLVDERAELESGNIDFVIFTSASTVRGFATAVDGIDFTRVKAICIGRQTKAAADSFGMQTWMAQTATIDSVIERLIEVKAECAPEQ